MGGGGGRGRRYLGRPDPPARRRRRDSDIKKQANEWCGRPNRKRIRLDGTGGGKLRNSAISQDSMMKSGFENVMLWRMMRCKYWGKSWIIWYE